MDANVSLVWIAFVCVAAPILYAFAKALEEER